VEVVYALDNLTRVELDDVLWEALELVQELSN
jgi:hypothetical protein